jgi:myo-inositol catabolism protein IolS
MQTRQLGRSGIDITALGLGTNYVGGHNLYTNVDEDEGVRLVRTAIDNGITSIDTADVYGTGRSEELVGKAIKGRRDKIMLASKGSILFGDNGSGVNNDPAYLRKALQASLQRLDVEHIDLYYIHRHDGKTPVEDSIGELNRFKEEGLIGAIGVSNFELPELEVAVKTAQIDALQSQYNLLQRDVEAQILPFCVQHNISFIPWGPLAYGLLGGRYARDFTLPEGDWRVRTGLFEEIVYPRSLDIVDALKAIAAAKDVAVAHVALQWLLSRPAVTSVICGAKQSAQVTQNIACDALVLSAKELASIDALVA